MLEDHRPTSFTGQSKQQLPGTGDHLGEEMRSSTLPSLRPSKFDSQSERACVALLEKYVEGWRAIEGATYQVPLGFDRRADFKIGNLIVEYHPIYPKWEFRDRTAWYDIVNAMNGHPRSLKHAIRAAIDKECAAEYVNKRQFTIRFSPDPEIRKCRLICVHSKEEFIEQVIKPLSGKGRQLSTRKLIDEWEKAIRGKEI